MGIIKRKKGTGEFYYLQYSFRKNNKVITKEVYLGKKIPSKEKLKKLKKELMKESSYELSLKLNAVKNNFQKEWKKFPNSVKEKELKQLAIAFTYNTNAIEGSTITLEETRDILEHGISPNKALKDVKETEAHAKVFFEMLSKEEKISEALLLKWHNEVFSASKFDIAGKYREYLVRVGDYIAPDWQDVKELMNKLIIFIQKNKSLNPVELAARSHYKFEVIHPFGDGNGRVGRLLMNYILWCAGYPMIIITYKKRKSYYKAFKKDEDYFVKYFIRYYLNVHKNKYLN
ncbi:Fic family protein [Candidatus Woesearchaeota archaeon]|nr:Fic family protein [Candidatus Woesearchaeota archaeon]